MQQKLCSMPLQIECFGPHAYDFLNVFVLYQYNLVFVKRGTSGSYTNSS